MSVDGVLDEALRDGIYLYVDDNKLKYMAAKNALSLELKRKLEAYKEEIIARLARGETPSEVDSPLLAVIPALDRESAGPLSLSFGQQRLWFFHQYLGPNAVYNMPLALRLRGEVNEAALKRSLEELHRRHESLRTRFESHDGGTVQVIDPPGLKLEVEAVPAAGVQAIAHAERFHRFDLSSERPCRVRPLRETGSDRGDTPASGVTTARADTVARGPIAAGGDTAARGDVGDYVLLVTMHHSVSDGWSLGIFFREFMSLYQAYTRGDDSPLAPLPIQYADYAQWQRRWLQGAVLEQQLSYWRERLKGLPPLLTLPTDRPRPTEQTFRGSTERFALPLALTEQLQALSREQGVTLYMTLLSAFAVLLGRYANQQDVAVGTPIANRTRRETEGLIGFFVNTLVMRHDLSGDPRFIDVLRHTRECGGAGVCASGYSVRAADRGAKPAAQSESFAAVSGDVRFAERAVCGAGATRSCGAAAGGGSGSSRRRRRARKHAEDMPEGTARFDLTLSMQESPAG